MNLKIKRPVGRRAFHRRSEVLDERGAVVGELHASHSDQSRAPSSYTFWPNAAGEALGLRRVEKPTQREAMAAASEQDAPGQNVIAQIAREHLGIETPETRNSDALDFHDLSVENIRRALKAAYDAGRGSR
jgi:hypothetical protein